jgi:carbamoyltransferase
MLHAVSAFVRSGMDEAVAIIIDGAGSMYDYGKEHLSVLRCGYLEDGMPFFEFIHQKVVGAGELIEDGKCPPWVDNYKCIGPGFAYSAATSALGWTSLENGKLMGIAPYGEEDENVPELLNINSSANLDAFSLMNSGPVNFAHFGPRGASLDKNDYINSIWKENTGTIGESGKYRTIAQNVAYRMQDDFEKYIINFFNKVLDNVPTKNIIYSGGCALNCVANYKLLKSLPEDVNLYIEPISADDGVALGGVISTISNAGETIPSFDGIYFGSQLEYDYILFKNESQKDTTAKEVATLLTEGNIVAIAQGKSESGPRALGNRSILFDPRVPDAKDIVNKVKNRESFRPFAGTVLTEHAKDWFDMDRLEESPYMMYAIDVIPEQQYKIASIVHVDGTCRIQTVSEEQNKNYYELIKEFYSITNVPIVLNTSFNLAEDTIVETIDDAFNTLRNSEIEYLYLPEIKKLIYVPNE